MKRMSIIVPFIMIVLSIGFAAGNLEDNGDGTVADSRTGLIWQQATAGPMEWGQAMVYCNNLVLAGYDDWRLPGLNELQSIIDSARSDPAIDTTVFLDSKSDHYWTSDTVEDQDGEAWHVDFSRGHEYQGFKTNQYYVRAVRP